MVPCHLVGHTSKGHGKGRSLDLLRLHLGGIYVYMYCVRYVLSSKTSANPLGTLITCELLARWISQSPHGEIYNINVVYDDKTE